MADEYSPSADVNEAPSQEATPSYSDQSGAPAVTSSSTASGQESSYSAPTSDSSHAEEVIPERTRKKYAEIESRYGNVTQWIAKNPERYKEALIETGNMSEEQALAEVRRLHPNYGQQAQPTQGNQFNQAPTGGPQHQAPAAPALSPMHQQALDELAYKKQQENSERQRIAQAFLEKHPNASYYQRQAVGATALEYEAQGLSMEEAFERARVQIIEPEKFRKLGEVEGMAKAYSSVGASKGGYGGGTPARSSATVTELDEEVMRKLGLDKNPKLKEKYLSRLGRS